MQLFALLRPSLQGAQPPRLFDQVIKEQFVSITADQDLGLRARSEPDTSSDGCAFGGERNSPPDRRILGRVGMLVDQ